jgi:hypothetical protein
MSMIWAIICMSVGATVWFKLWRMFYFRPVTFMWTGFVAFIVGYLFWYHPVIGIIVLLLMIVGMVANSKEKNDVNKAS